MQRNTLPQTEGLKFPEVISQPVMWGCAHDPRQAKRYKALVDARTGKLFAIVSKDYRLIRHEEAIERIEAAIHERDDLGHCEVHTEFYNQGGRMRTTYRFTEVAVEVQAGDVIKPQLHLCNSYDLSWPLIVHLGAFRVVCTNGLVVREEFFHLRKRHIIALDQMHLRKEVSTALQRFYLQTKEWKNWAERQITEDLYTEVMKAMNLGKKAAEEIEDRVHKEAEGFDGNAFPIISLWVFFNILTWYITHKAASLNHRVEMEKRLRAAMSYLIKK